MKAEIKDGKLIVTVELHAPVLSKSGKTFVVASSYGNKVTEATVDGKAVVVGLNAYVARG